MCVVVVVAAAAVEFGYLYETEFAVFVEIEAVFVVEQKVTIAETAVDSIDYNGYKVVADKRSYLLYKLVFVDVALYLLD